MSLDLCPTESTMTQSRKTLFDLTHVDPNERTVRQQSVKVRQKSVNGLSMIRQYRQYDDLTTRQSTTQRSTRCATYIRTNVYFDTRSDIRSAYPLCTPHSFRVLALCCNTRYILVTYDHSVHSRYCLDTAWKQQTRVTRYTTIRWTKSRNKKV